MKIEANKWYPSREAAAMLAVTEETVKKYCREGKMPGRKLSSKKRWHVQGSAIIDLRKEWGLEEIEN